MQWCGLKSEYNRLFHTCVEVTTDAVVWIEIGTLSPASSVSQSPLMQWCGLKSPAAPETLICMVSPLMQWCGLKLNIEYFGLFPCMVTTDAVVWIEMYYKVSGSALYMSPLMQWCGLKYFKQNFKHFLIMVTTDAVVWIEMLVYL